MPRIGKPLFEDGPFKLVRRSGSDTIQFVAMIAGKRHRLSTGTNDLEAAKLKMSELRATMLMSPGTIESAEQYSFSLPRIPMRRHRPTSKIFRDIISKLYVDRRLLTRPCKVNVTIFWKPGLSLAVGRHMRDVDNVAKWVLDAMTGIFFQDDCLVFELMSKRVVSTSSRVLVEVAYLTDAQFHEMHCDGVKWQLSDTRPNDKKSVNPESSISYKRLDGICEPLSSPP